MNVYLRSLDDQTQLPIEEGENLLLGRMDPCDIVVNDGSVSSRHARLSLSDGVLVVSDLDSTNGTRVNYSLLAEPMALMDGDTVEFGNVSFLVDGPGLRAEREQVTGHVVRPSAPVFELPESSDATMQLAAVSDEDLLEDTPVVLTDLEAVVAVGEVPREALDPETEPDPETVAAREFAAVQQGRVLVTGLLFLCFIGLLGLYLWRHLPEL